MCRRLIGASLPVLMLALVVGCGNEKKVVKINGKAVRGGNPVPNMLVHFMPTEGRPSWGKTDDQGRFTLSYDLERDGVEVGTHNVYVEFRASSAEEAKEELFGRRKLSKDQQEIAAKYGNPQKPALNVTIEKSGQDVVLNLD